MDVHLDLNMTMIRPLEGYQQSEYLKEFGDIYKRLEKRLEPLLVNQDQWKRDKSYLRHEDRIVVPSDRVPALLKWTHESSSHVGADRTLRLFKQWFHTTSTDEQLRKTLQPIMDKCPCRSCKPGDIRDRGLYSTLPIPHCANSVLYVDYTEMPKIGGYDFALVVTCGLTRFTRVFPGTKHITGEETIKILKILSLDGHRMTVRCSLCLGGTVVCAAQHLKRYQDPEDLCGEEWELNDEEIAALDLQGAASPIEVEGELPDMNAEEMAKKGFYLVKCVLRHRYRHGWRFLTLWEGFGVEEATREPFSAFVLPEGRLKLVLVDYLSQNNLGELLRHAQTLASKTKARD